MFCIVCFLRARVLSGQTNPGQQARSSSDLDSELEDSRKFSLNSNYPTLTRLFHVVPLLGTSCMAGVALVSGLQSPALAVVGILLGVLPLVTLVVHHGRQCHAETSSQGLPMQIQDIPAPSGSSVAGTTEAKS
ncbi:hypothetical protein JVU11DRAFT_3736 [Chiua virens]|nr:hypothetical protein JVU11DRAFT_3736 [Chiua virens]